MPTYDYVCVDCTNQFEEFQKMSDPLLEICPECDGRLKRKIGGGAGLLFKGSGFYITDYKNKKSGSENRGKSEKPDKASKKKKDTEKEVKKA